MKKRVRRILPILASSMIPCSCIQSSAMTQQMFNNVSSLLEKGDGVPKEIGNTLKSHLRKLSLDTEPVLTYGNLSIDLVKQFFKNAKDENGAPYNVIEVDLSTMNYENFVSSLGSARANGRCVVLIDSFFVCKYGESFNKVLNLLKNSQNTFLYVQYPHFCIDNNCKNCNELQHELFCSSTSSCMSKIIFNCTNWEFYRDWLTNVFDSCKKMHENGELDISIDLTDKDIETLSMLLEGPSTSISDVKKIIKKAFISAEQRDSVLRFIDFVKITLDTYIGESSATIANDGDQRVITAHECGHAIVANNEGLDVRYILARKGPSGLTVNCDISKQELPSVKYMLSLIKTLMAGKIAEDTVNNSGGTVGCESDYAKVKILLDRVVAIRDPSLEYRENDKKTAVLKLYDELYSETTKIVKDNLKVIEKMADRLNKREFVNGIKLMTGDEFKSSLEEIKEEIKKENELDERFKKILSGNELSTEFVDYVENYFAGKTDVKNTKA